MYHSATNAFFVLLFATIYVEYKLCIQVFQSRKRTWSDASCRIVVSCTTSNIFVTKMYIDGNPSVQKGSVVFSRVNNEKV